MLKKIICLGAVFLMFFTLYAKDADLIFKKYGRTKGFCLIIGAKKDGSLPIQILNNSEMLVHVIDSNQKNLNLLKSKIEKQSLSGRIQTGHSSLEKIPFVDDIINLLIIENSSLKLSDDEINRVVAPGGLICKYDGNDYNFKIKKRSVGMGTWLHPAGDVGLNRKGNDKKVPLIPRLRWQDGLPISFSLWAPCRAFVISENYCFTLSSCEIENLNPTRAKKVKKELYLTARDAYSGLPLWKINCKETDDASGLNPRNFGPLVANSKSVYSYKQGEIFEAEAKTGKITQTFSVSYPTTRLMLKENILVASGYKEKKYYGVWHPWVSSTKDGKLEIFDISTGKKIWDKIGSYQDIAIVGDTLVSLVHFWPEPPKKKKTRYNPDVKTVAKVIGYNIKTGKLLWEIADKNFSSERAPTIVCAGEGVAVISHLYESKGIVVISTKTGEKLWQKSLSKNKKNFNWVGALWASIIDKTLWLKNNVYDLKTGKQIGRIKNNNTNMCVPPIVLDHLIISKKKTNIYPRNDKKNQKFSIAAGRGACLEGFAPANGMLYTAQNRCQCKKDTLEGFMALGTSPQPKDEDFSKKRTIEKGSSYGKLKKITLEKGAFPIFLANNDRNSRIENSLPKELKILWSTSIEKEKTNPLLNAWKSRGRNLISSPVTGYNKVFTSSVDKGIITAINANNGKLEWTFSAEGRVDMAPTLAHGMVIFGCRNGWIYSVNATDGTPWVSRFI